MCFCSVFSDNKELVVFVQGPRPENILFLIHEVFESIIEESFNGVSYDLYLPCPDCVSKEVRVTSLFVVLSNLPLKGSNCPLCKIWCMFTVLYNFEVSYLKVYGTLAVFMEMVCLFVCANLPFAVNNAFYF